MDQESSEFGHFYGVTHSKIFFLKICGSFQLIKLSHEKKNNKWNEKKQRARSN